MGKVRHEDLQVSVEIMTGTSGDRAVYMDDEKAEALLDKHMTRWSTLLERLK